MKTIHLLVIAGFALVGGSLGVAPVAAKDLPKLSEVEATVVATLHADRRYETGDILTRKQVTAVVDALEQIGWKLDDRKKLEKLALENGSFLVEKLSTAGGKKFLRQIEQMPLAIDRLDRLSQMRQGHSTVERLIKGPDGYKLFDYMTNAKGGDELTKMLSKDGHGDFNKATGKIYTEEQLLYELEKLHKAAEAALRTTARK